MLNTLPFKYFLLNAVKYGKVQLNRGLGGCDYLREKEPMKKKIGEMAGKVWKTLAEKGDVDISRLPQILKEKGEVVYQALGWLAREDKIDYHKKEGKTFVSLGHEEREIFKKSL
jgi:hypothetical protein